MFISAEIQPAEDQTKDKASKFLVRLKSKKEKFHTGSQPHGRYLALINTVRVQMQVWDVDSDVF